MADNYEERLAHETSVLSEHGLAHYFDLTAQAVEAATKQRQDHMAKALGNRSGRRTKAQVVKAAKRGAQEGAVFYQISATRCQLMLDGRLVEYDVPYLPDDMTDALRRGRVPKGTKVTVESKEGKRTPLTVRW